MTTLPIPVMDVAAQRDLIRLEAELLSEDGQARVTGSLTAVAPGEALAADLLARAPDAVRRQFAA